MCCTYVHTHPCTKLNTSTNACVYKYEDRRKVRERKRGRENAI